MITFKNLEEMKPYYDKESNTYIIDDNITIEFDLSVMSNINALDINARDITAGNIDALDINARDITAGNIDAFDITALDITALNINALNIKAGDIIARNINSFDNIKAKQISYYAVCFAYHNINCSKINERRSKSKHFCLDGKITIEEEEKNENSKRDV